LQRRSIEVSGDMLTIMIRSQGPVNDLLHATLRRSPWRYARRRRGEHF
jgi:hypothetical protein